MKYTIKEMTTMKENHVFDRISAKKDPKSFSNHIVAFANADGGILAIGIEDDGEITGIDGYIDNINDLARIPYDYCKPSVPVSFEKVSCTDKDGKSNHLLIITVPQSSELHANQHDDVYLRMGDKSRKLTFDERMQLLFSKGVRYFEDEPVADSSIEDLDLDFVSEYCHKIGYKNSAREYILKNKEFTVLKNGEAQMSGAAILLFSSNPQRFFKRACVRFIRYDGTIAKVGTKMNVIKDEVFKGRILDVIEKSIKFVLTQIKERTFLGQDGLFLTQSEYPHYVIQELIVNAVAHRDYSIKGTDIQVKMYDDRIVVESPGTLPGIVRLSNMRTTHFSRNPKIAEFLQEYDYVKEFGEGVDRIYAEMNSAGLPKPEYEINDFMLKVTIRNGSLSGEDGSLNGSLKAEDGSLNGSLSSEDGSLNGSLSGEDGSLNGSLKAEDGSLKYFDISNTEKLIYEQMAKKQNIMRQELAEVLGISLRTVDRAIKTLTEKGLIQRIGSKKYGHWQISKQS